MAAIATAINEGGFSTRAGTQHGVGPSLLQDANWLSFSMQKQQKSNLCWAAVGASVGNYYWGTGSYTQCGIANICQNKSTCCNDLDGCNTDGVLDKALQAAKSFDSMAAGTASFAVLQRRVDIGQPVGTRVAWFTGGAHFTMISGYNTDGNKIDVQDSWYGPTTIAYAAYPAKYHDGGSWSHTYFTKKQ
ncbi:papain-like cysteine protease family protein [Sphingomonas sp.]|uniref:papain-like cysteine protease family protein n=2 Tax=unclassified Sphingomonas TaxID=196159 RepID=UPI0035A84DDF